MLRVLYPIHLDRWTTPLTNVLREIALRNPDMQFCSFSHPASDEDRTLGAAFWRHPHIHAVRPAEMLRRRFDIVHHRSVTATVLGALALTRARSLGRCVQVFTAAQVDPHDPYHRNYRLAARNADLLVAVSHRVAADMHAVLGRAPDAIIPNGADLALFDPAAARPLDEAALGFGPPFVLFVGMLKPRKRPDIFLRLAAQFPHVPFVLAGGAFSEQERAPYAAEAARLPNVHLLGLQPRQMVRDLMAHAAALVFPSELEGLPLTVIEAAAMGLPVLAQPASSLPEVVHDGVTGWLLPLEPPHEPLDAWAARLHSILGWSPAERQAFAQGARAFVQQHYSWGAIARQYRALYRQAAGLPPEASL